MKTITSTGVYSLIKHPDMGYAVLKKEHGFWQQVSKWYSYKGNATKVYKAMLQKCTRQCYKSVQGDDK